MQVLDVRIEQHIGQLVMIVMHVFLLELMHQSIFLTDQ